MYPDYNELAEAIYLERKEYYDEVRTKEKTKADRENS